MILGPALRGDVGVAGPFHGELVPGVEMERGDSERAPKRSERFLVREKRRGLPSGVEEFNSSRGICKERLAIISSFAFPLSIPRLGNAGPQKQTFGGTERCRTNKRTGTHTRFVDPCLKTGGSL